MYMEKEGKYTSEFPKAQYVAVIAVDQKENMQAAKLMIYGFKRWHLY